MDGGLKQRLIGAFVLVALAVIFIPILLDNQREDAPMASRIPPEPAAEDVREIPLNLEEAHRKVVEEQQALVAQTAPDTAVSNTPTEPVPDVEPTEDLPAAESTEVEAPAPQVAAQPGVKPSAEAKVVPPEAAESKPVETVSAQAASARTQPAKTAPAAEGQDAIGAFLESAWVVQAGVFGNEVNAKGLAVKLKASGFKAFTKRTPEGTRVFIGPELDRAKAQAMLPRVQQITQVRPMVVPFDPVQH